MNLSYWYIVHVHYNYLTDSDIHQCLDSLHHLLHNLPSIRTQMNLSYWYIVHLSYSYFQNYIHQCPGSLHHLLHNLPSIRTQMNLSYWYIVHLSYSYFQNYIHQCPGSLHHYQNNLPSIHIQTNLLYWYIVRWYHNCWPLSDIRLYLDSLHHLLHNLTSIRIRILEFDLCTVHLCRMDLLCIRRCLVSIVDRYNLLCNYTSSYCRRNSLR